MKLIFHLQFQILKNLIDNIPYKNPNFIPDAAWQVKHCQVKHLVWGIREIGIIGNNQFLILDIFLPFSRNFSGFSFLFSPSPVFIEFPVIAVPINKKFI
jgi:hypothetical protein